MKEKIAEMLVKPFKENDLKFKKEEIIDFLESPPSIDMGDFALPCFQFSKKLKIPPNEIALKIRKEITSFPKEIKDVRTSGPYVNFILNKKVLTSNLLNEIFKEEDKFGKPKKNLKNKIKTMIEFPSPNTNKPLHLGHLRNMSIGESISRVKEFNGEKVIRACLYNDRGIHICQSMAAYKKYGKNKTPEEEGKKSDHFVGDFYVKFKKNSEKNISLEKESHRLLQKWEEEDPETRVLWTKMNSWALKGFKETFSKFDIRIDKEYFESSIYNQGRDLVNQGLKKGIFEKRKDNAIIAKFSEKELGEKILLRQDGTSVYITQDLYLANKKFEDFDLNKSIYVTGNEQEYHFKVLFKLLEMLEIAKRERMEHLSYGMVELPEGKMKSREGKVVDADDLIMKVEELVSKTLKEKNKKISKKEIQKRAPKISLACIKYMLLKTDIKKNMVFDPKKSIDFEGDTGSYLLYTYARASSILRKLKIDEKDEKIEELEKKEKELIMKIYNFKKIVEKSYNQSNPSFIANYSFELSKIFNEFYHECPVMKSKRQSFRKKLVRATKQTLKNSLNLLGIETLEEM